jgi:hypothetical protein
VNTPGVIYVTNSKNVKIGAADATYVSIAASCPSTCGLRDQGCYAQTSGFLGLLARRLNTEARAEGNTTPEAIANAEGNAIRGSYGGGPVPTGRALRLHVSGDARTSGAARIIAGAVRQWKKRGGGPAWNYTHAWRRVRREAWSIVSTLASIESPCQAADVRAQGYAPALVVAEHPADGRAWESHGVRWIPCPAQTRDDVTCTSCRLCFDADALFERNAGITFAAHGGGAIVGRVKRRLALLQETGTP